MTTPLQRWADNPDGGGLYTGLRERILAHNPACTSLDWIWLPRRGGTVCPSDLDVCDDCNVWFYVEGIGMYEINSNDVLLCQCCAKKAGVS